MAKAAKDKNRLLRCFFRLNMNQYGRLRLLVRKFLDFSVFSALARITVSFAAKIAIVKLSRSEQASDLYFLAVSISSSVFSVCNSLIKPAIINLMSHREGRSSKDLKAILSELSTLQLIGTIPVLAIAIPIVFLYAQVSREGSVIGLCQMVALACISFVIAEIIVTNASHLRIQGSNKYADKLLLAYSLLTTFCPIIILPFRGNIGYLLVSTLIAVLFLGVFLCNSNCKIVSPSNSLLSEVFASSRHMIKVALLSKFIPLVESASINTFSLPGTLSSYSLIRSAYGSILTLVDMSLIQKLIAQCQRKSLLGNNYHIVRDWMNLLLFKALCASCVMIPVTIFFLVISIFYGGEIYKSSAQSAFRYIAIALSLYPFAVSSIVSLLTSPLLYILNDVRYAARLGAVASLPVLLVLPLAAMQSGVIGVSFVLGAYTSFIAAMHYYRVIKLTSSIA